MTAVNAFKKSGVRESSIISLIIAGCFLFSILLRFLFPGIMGTWDARIQDQFFKVRYALADQEQEDGCALDVMEAILAREALRRGKKQASAAALPGIDRFKLGRILKKTTGV